MSRLRRSGTGPAALRRTDVLPAGMLAAAPRRSTGRSRSYEPEAERVCRRDADNRNPRRNDPEHTRPFADLLSTQFSSTQHRVASRREPHGSRRRSRAPGSSARMAKRMLIDAAHPEETRVVVTNGHRLEEFDFESSTKKQVKGNIYLAKVTRVEPSLQAAFVDYGGNRHGFLAFSEIHPDYYRIPVSDRRHDGAEPIAAGAQAADDAGDEAGVTLAAALPEPVAVPEPLSGDDDAAEDEEAAEPALAQQDEPPHAEAASESDAAPDEHAAAEEAPPDSPEPAAPEYAGAESPAGDSDAIALRSAEETVVVAEAVAYGDDAGRPEPASEDGEDLSPA